MTFFEGLRRQFVLMHVSGIPVRADVRWVFVIALMTAVIAASLSSFAESSISAVIFGLVTTLVFFGSIFLHEYAHAAVAKMEGIEVLEIALHPFGGLTRFRREPETPRAEFRIAIAGPAASFLLALVFAVVASAATSIEAEILVILAATLAVGNFLLAVFNLFPGYPLDGGRVLRAYLWRSGKDLNEATILTGRCGQAIAAVMMIFGIFVAILRGDFFTGSWALLVGLFLWDSAKGIIHEVHREERVAVENAMMLPVTLSHETTIHDLVDKILPMHRQSAFAITKDRTLLGVLMLVDMKSVPREEWRSTAVCDIMRPVTADHFVTVGTSLAEAREIARSNGIGSVYVLDRNGALVGVIRGASSRVG